MQDSRVSGTAETSRLNLDLIQRRVDLLCAFCAPCGMTFVADKRWLAAKKGPGVPVLAEKHIS